MLSASVRFHSCADHVFGSFEGWVGFSPQKQVSGTASFRCTPLIINMEPENHLFEKENHLPNRHFQVPCWSSRVYLKSFFWKMALSEIMGGKGGDFCFPETIMGWLVAGGVVFQMSSCFGPGCAIEHRCYQLPLWWTSAVASPRHFWTTISRSFGPFCNDKVCDVNVSNEKRAPGCLGIGDYTAQFCWDYNKALEGSLLTNQYTVMERFFFFS